MSGDLPAFAIFRPGCFTSMEGTPVSFDAGDLTKLAAVYNRRSDRAPIVIDHPDDDRPIYGTVGRASFKDGHLWAHPSDVAPALQSRVRQGSTRGVSARFLPATHPKNPSPGSLHLQHVGFLVNKRPAVKGLPAVSFAESGFVHVDLPLSFADGSNLPMSVRARQFAAGYVNMPLNDAFDILQLKEQLAAVEMSFAVGDGDRASRASWNLVRELIEARERAFKRR